MCDCINKDLNIKSNLKYLMQTYDGPKESPTFTGLNFPWVASAYVILPGAAKWDTLVTGILSGYSL